MCGYPDVIGYAEDLFETVSALAISWRKSMKRSIGIVVTLGTVVALGFISVNLAQRGLRSLGTQFGGAGAGRLIPEQNHITNHLPTTT